MSIFAGGLSLLVIGLILALAVGVGERLHRRRTASLDDSHGGPSLGLFVDGALTLAVVTCAFMLAVSYSAYNAANRDAGAEAGTVAGLYEAASLLPARSAAKQLQQDTICYARSVVSDEWPRLGETRDASPRVESWRVRLREDLLATARTNDDSALGAVRDADIERTTARQTRLVTSRQHAPDYLFALLILVSAIAVIMTTAFTISSIPSPLRRAMVGVLVVLLGLMLAVIINLDRPFAGFQRIQPSDLAQVTANDTADYVRDWQEPVRICDATGRPTP